MIGRRFVLGGLAATAAGAAMAQAGSFNGSWTGVLDIGSGTLRLRLVINADGSAVLYSLDQGAQPIPGRVTSRDADLIFLEFPLINARYEARLAGPDRLEGAFTQGQSLPLAMVRGDAAVAAGPAAAAAAPPPPPAVPLTDDLLESYRAAAGSPAFAAAADKGGRRRAWATGERVRGMGLPVSTDDKWHMGSITKSMTATLVARLVEAGRIAWTDTPGTLLKAAAPQMRPEYQAVTLRHLLSHASGMPGNIPIPELLAFSQQLDDARAERLAFAHKALAMAPVSAPGTQFLYSNNGYVVVGAMLEAKLGESWESLIRKHLFEPLGLSSAGFGAPAAEGSLDQPVGHTLDAAGQLQPVLPGVGLTDNPVALGPAGRVHMTLADMLAYLAAHRDRAALLKPETWDMLHTQPFGGEYAMGWVVRSDGTRWHNGSNTMWYAEAAFDRAAGWAGVAVANDGRPPIVAPHLTKALRGAAAAV